MTIFLVILHVIACFMLIAVILLQAGRGQGLTGTSFGWGGSVQTLFGTKAADFLTKATSVCAILFLITCISLDVIESRKAHSIVKAPGAKEVSKEDITKIKEALEKLKAEAEKQKTSASTGSTAESAKTAATETKAAAPAPTQPSGQTQK